MNSPIDRYFIAVRELMIPDGDEPRRKWFEALVQGDTRHVAGTLLLTMAAVAGSVVPLGTAWFSVTHLLNIGPSYIDSRLGLLLAFALVAGACLIGTGVFLVIFRMIGSLFYRLGRPREFRDG